MLSLFGDKIRARSLAIESDVPVVRGSGNLVSGDECIAVIEDGIVRLPAIMKVRVRAIHRAHSMNNMCRAFN